MKKLLKGIGAILLILILIVCGYILYLFADFSRIEDSTVPEISGNATALPASGETFTLVTWNLGFGAYSDDYSFFMDGGTESRAYSADAVRKNFSEAILTLNAIAPDLILLQEIDLDATRSYHIDQSAILSEAFPEMNSVTAVNYNSSYLFYPVLEPHGKTKSGLMTLSAFGIDSAIRRSLPIETGFMKFFDLDRCFTVSRIPLENGRTLSLYNIHLSAYTSDGSIATEQLHVILESIQADYANGGYVIVGGDFNKDLLGDSSAVFGVPGEEFSWAQPFPTDIIPAGFTLVDSLNPAAPVPSCRNADKAYNPETSFVLTIDGFIVSDNIEVVSCEVYDAGFANSDHNPVVMEFRFID